MTPEGILTGEDLKFDSSLGARVVRMLHAREVVELHRARERQLRLAAKQEERRRFGNGATVTMSLDPVIFMRIAKDPRFTANAFGEKEFEKDMRKWHPEFMVKTRHTTKSFALGGISEDRGHKSEARSQRARPARYNKDAKYLIKSDRS